MAETREGEKAHMKDKYNVEGINTLAMFGVCLFWGYAKTGARCIYDAILVPKVGRQDNTGNDCLT